MASRGGKPEKVAVQVNAVAGNLGIRGMLKRAVIWRKWREIVGESIAEMAWPKTFRNRDVLVVAVADSAWMHHLSYLKPDILKRLNELLEDDALLSDMRFVIDDLSAVRAETVKAGVEDARPERSKDALPSELHSRAENLAGQVVDPDLRRLLHDLYLNNAARHLACNDDS